MTIFLRLAAALTVSLTAAAALIVPAQAQTRASPAALTDVQIISQSPVETKIRLDFSPRANTFAPVGSDPFRPALGLALTNRNNSAVTPPRLSGLVRAITFDQVETVLILRFATSAPATVKAAAINETSVEITVATGAVQRQVSSDDAGVRGGTVPTASNPPPGEDGYELVMLKYADVSEVVGLLSDGLTIKSNDTFTPREPAFGSNSLTGSSYNPGPMIPSPGSDDKPLGQSIDSSIAVDRRLNAVWLKGSKARIQRMKDMIALIDVPVDSVILETELVELTETGAKAVGFDFTNANGQIGVATVQTGQFIPPGYPPNQGPRLTSAALQGALYAQVQKGQGKIVSKPRISAQSGSTAKIITGDALPILTNITLSGVNGVSQQVQYVNVGVTLQIAPRVAADGSVTSHVFCVVSSVSGYSQGYPTISQREAETSATVQDGESFVIGGLTQESTITSRSKVPLLGDVPLLGQAFRTDRATKSKTDLYIVITPHVVHRRLDSAPPLADPAAIAPKAPEAMR